MKKKFGFTLAEVLITLTIIGVVAALAAPALSGAFQKSKVGPSLRKLMGTLENANELMLHRNDSDRLSFVTNNTSDYLTKISTIVKGSTPADAGKRTLSNYTLKNYNNTAYAGNPDGADESNAIVYNLDSGESIAVLKRDTIEEPAGSGGSAQGIFADVYYDLNGFDKTPNKWGKDIFIFVMDDNGSVIPKYSKAYSDTYFDAETNNTWESITTNLCTETTVTTGVSCAGAIADNFWKVNYKY